jgi:hypothetical protein
MPGHTLLEAILAETAPVILIGAIAAIWRFATRLQQNTQAVNEMKELLPGVVSRLQSLENWRDLVSAQAVGKDITRSG